MNKYEATGKTKLEAVKNLLARVLDDNPNDEELQRLYEQCIETLQQRAYAAGYDEGFKRGMEPAEGEL